MAYRIEKHIAARGKGLKMRKKKKGKENWRAKNGQQLEIRDWGK